MKKNYLLVLLAVLLCSCGNQTSKCDYDLSDPKYLSIYKMDATESEIKDLCEKADALLDTEPLTIVTKEATTPSGDKHDYISMAPYLWPNPDTPDHLPYVPRDGEINPESRTKYTDQGKLSNTCTNVYTLGKAYYYTQDQRYAAKINELLNVFFVDPETKMNPNLKYAQFVPGRSEGRSFGIIETSKLSWIIEGIAFIDGSSEWKADTEAGMKEWCASYLEWLTTHKYGITEMNANNNHGTHFDAQALGLYIYSGDIEGAKRHINTYSLDRIAKHAAEDGSQPQELRRTKSWNYTTMNLRGWVEIAIMADKLGIDLWNYGTDEQIYMKSMIDWFFPFLKGEREWTHKQIVTMLIENIDVIYDAAADYYNDELYREIANNQVLIKK